MRPGRHSAGGGISRGEPRKYGILKFGRFWRIDVCIADNDILHPLARRNAPPVLGPRPQLSLLHDPTQGSVYTKKLTLVI